MRESPGGRQGGLWTLWRMGDGLVRQSPKTVLRWVVRSTGGWCGGLPWRLVDLLQVLILQKETPLGRLGNPGVVDGLGLVEALLVRWTAGVQVKAAALLGIMAGLLVDGVMKEADLGGSLVRVGSLFRGVEGSRGFGRGLGVVAVVQQQVLKERVVFLKE